MTKMENSYFSWDSFDKSIHQASYYHLCHFKMISEHRKQNHMQPATFHWIYTAHPINKIDFRIYVLQVSLYFVLQTVRKGDITREKFKCQGMIKGWADFWALANWQSHDFCKYMGQKKGLAEQFSNRCNIWLIL